MVIVEGDEVSAAAKDEEPGPAEDHAHQAEGRRNKNQNHQLLRAVPVHVFKESIERQAQADEDDHA